MTNFQTEILNEFENIVDEKGYTFVVQKHWANTGSIFIMKNFDCVAEGSFQFNTNYAGICFNYPNKLIGSDYNNNIVGSSYLKYNSELPEFINDFKKFVNQLESVG